MFTYLLILLCKIEKQFKWRDLNQIANLGE